jgi:hypothetical protein
VGAKQEEIDERDKQIVTLQAALIDKYEDIRSQIFTAEQMARYKAFEARLRISASLVTEMAKIHFICIC